MTAFPAITPSSRAFTPGQYANTPFEALSGGQTRVRHSDAYAAAQLQLTFAAISEADMLAIWNHFINRTGTFQSFTLPAEVFSQDDATDYTAQSVVWIYASSGVVEDLPCGGHNVQLELRTVPSANVVLIGIAIGVSIKLVAGAAAAANGAQLTVGVSIEIGGIWILGLAATVTASLSTVGTATGGVGVSGEGVIAEIRASLNPGFAFAGLSRVFTINTSLLTSANLVRSAITYSQSSVWPSSTPANNAIMTDGSVTNDGAATDGATSVWIKMDLGASFEIYEVVVGTATSNIPGGWDKSYTENKNVQYSTDNTNWTTAFNTGSFASNGIYTFAVSFTARYIRIFNSTTGGLGIYVAISEFYVNALPDPPATGGANAPGAAKTVTATLAEGAASSP